MNKHTLQQEITNKVALERDNKRVFDKQAIKGKGKGGQSVNNTYSSLFITLHIDASHVWNASEKQRMQEFAQSSKAYGNQNGTLYVKVTGVKQRNQRDKQAQKTVCDLLFAILFKNTPRDGGNPPKKRSLHKRLQNKKEQQQAGNKKRKRIKQSRSQKHRE